MTLENPQTGSLSATDLVISPGVRETTSGDGAVLLDIEQGICFSLNPVGLRIWELLKTRSSIDQIADALVADFNVPRGQLLADTVEFVVALKTNHLVRCGGEPVAPRSRLAAFLPWGKRGWAARGRA